MSSGSRGLLPMTVNYTERITKTTDSPNAKKNQQALKRRVKKVRRIDN
jgi:hypothetical protein